MFGLDYHVRLAACLEVTIADVGVAMYAENACLAPPELAPVERVVVIVEFGNPTPRRQFSNRQLAKTVSAMS